MALSPHVEVEAAKFLQKLIQESKDEPVKLATKLFVICQHMKLSGKEHSLPYQVISRAMETVLAQNGIDRNALRSSNLVLASGSVSADLNPQSTNSGNESRLSEDKGNAEVQRSKDKDVAGCSTGVDTDSLRLSRAMIVNGKGKEEMPSTLKMGSFTCVGSSVGTMASSGSDSSKYGPKDTSGSLLADLNSQSVNPGGGRGNAEVQNSKDKDAGGSSAPADTDALHPSRTIIVNPRAEEEIPSTVKTGQFIGRGSSAGCKLVSPGNDSTCGPMDTSRSPSTDLNSQSADSGNKCSAEVQKLKDKDIAGSSILVDTDVLHVRGNTMMVNVDAKDEMPSLKTGTFSSVGSSAVCNMAFSGIDSGKHGPKDTSRTLEDGKHLDLHRKDSIGSDMQASEKCLEGTSKKASVKRKRAASGTILKDDNARKIRQRKNLSVGTNECKQEVGGKDSISTEEETKDAKSFKTPSSVFQNEQSHISPTFSSVAYTQGLTSQATCAVDKSFIHGNAPLLTKVARGTNQVSQFTSVNFNGPFGRDIKLMPKTKESFSEQDHLKLGMKEMPLADSKLDGAIAQSTDRNPRGEPFEHPSEQQAKDSPGVQVKAEIFANGQSTLGQKMSGLNAMPHIGAQGLQESSYKFQSSQQGKECTETNMVPQKFADSHFNSSEENQDSSPEGFKSPLQSFMQSTQVVSKTGIQSQTKVDAPSQISRIFKCPLDPRVPHPVIDSVSQLHWASHGGTDQAPTSPRKELGSDCSRPLPASSGKHVALFPKHQVEVSSNAQVSMKEQQLNVTHSSSAMKEEMTPRQSETESSTGVSDIGLQGKNQPPKILGADIHSASLKKNDEIHGALSSSSVLQIGHSHSRVNFQSPGQEDHISAPIRSLTRANLVSKFAPNELQLQIKSSSKVDSSVSDLSHDLDSNKFAAFSKGAIDSEAGRSEQAKMPLLSAAAMSVGEHLTSSADRGDGFASAQKRTGSDIWVSSPLTNQRVDSQDVGRHVSSTHQIGTAAAQDGGKMDPESVVENKMQRDEKNFKIDHASTFKSVSADVNDTRSKSHVPIESTKSGCSSSQSKPNHGYVERRPTISNLPFKDYQLKQLRAQCLVFLAFRNKIPPKALHLEVALDFNQTKNKATCETEIGKKEKSEGEKEPFFEGKAGEHPSSAAQEKKMVENKETETEKSLTPRMTPSTSCSGSPVEAESSSKELDLTRKGKRKKYPRIDPNLTKEERKRVMAARRKAEAAEQAEEKVKSKRTIFSQSDLQYQTKVAGLDAQSQTKVGGCDAQSQTKVAGLDAQSQTKVVGLDAQSQTEIVGMDVQPQTNTEVATFVKHHEDSGKLGSSNPQAANENHTTVSVSSTEKQFEKEYFGMLENGGLQGSTQEKWTVTDGKQMLETKRTEDPIIDPQETDGQKSVNTTHSVDSANAVAGSCKDGPISSSARNPMVRLPNEQFASLEELAKSVRTPMMAQSSGALAKPEKGESTNSALESITARSISESHPQPPSSFPLHASKQPSPDGQIKASSSVVINNGAPSLNPRFQDGNQNLSVHEGKKDSSLEDSPAIPSKPKYTTVEKWILDQRKRKKLEEENWAQKQSKTEAKIAVCFHHLKAVVSSSEDISAKTKSVIELKKLQLLQLQRRLRRDFLHDFFKPITSEIDMSKTMKKNRPGRRMKQLERLELKMKEERQRRIRERQKEFFSDIEAHKEKMEDWYKIKRERYRGFNRYVKEFHKRKDRTYREKVERIQREKINLLKNNDVEGYLRMVKDAKSDRVKQLLKETEGYLQKLGLRLQEQKSRCLESEMDETCAVNEINGNELGSMTTEGNYQAQHYLESNEKYYLMAHSVKENIYEQPCSLEGGTLREYQMNGLRWLVSLYNNHLNGILADEMGLGKTVQVIALICYLMEKKNDRGPFLVVVPSSVLSGWVSEISFWAPSICKIAYTGSPEERRRLFREKICHQKFNVLLTTYEYLMNKHDRPKLSKISWHYIIIDEGHRIKNANCKLNAELRHYQSSHRLLLTGTPLQNNLEELWALLNFLLPSIFNSSEDFSQWFSKPFENVADSSPDQALLTEEENLLIINRLHQVLRPFMLRRLKHKVENELPEKIECLVRCEASAYQKLLMKRVEENLGSLYHAKGRSVHNTVMELRNICNHPYLSQLHAEEINNMLPPHYLPPIVRLCAKLETLDRILPKLKATNHRVLLFSTMTRLLDVMEEYLTWKGYRYLRLDGHTCGNDRGMLIEQFNRPDSDAFLFLLSIRAGGVGINLQAADTVIIFDTDWNPQVDLQAQARAHRIGQKRDVLVLRFETVHSVEEQVRAAAEHKLGVANQSITAGFFDNNTSAEDRREYLEELLRGSKKEEDALVLNDEALNYRLARSESEIDIFEAVDRMRNQAEQEKWLNCIQGKGGDETVPMPPRLVGEEELKPFIMAMQAYDTANTGSKKRLGSSFGLDTQHYGRGKRAREVRSYGDQLTEEEFERLCQAGAPDSPKNPNVGKDVRKTANAVKSVTTIDGVLPAKRGRGRPKRVPGPSLLPTGLGKCQTDASSSGSQVSASVRDIKDHANLSSLAPEVQQENKVETSLSSVEAKFESTVVSFEKCEFARGATKSPKREHGSIEKEIDRSHFEDANERKNVMTCDVVTVPVLEKQENDEDNITIDTHINQETMERSNVLVPTDIHVVVDASKNIDTSVLDISEADPKFDEGKESTECQIDTVGSILDGTRSVCPEPNHPAHLVALPPNIETHAGQILEPIRHPNPIAMDIETPILAPKPVTMDIETPIQAPKPVAMDIETPIQDHQPVATDIETSNRTDGNIQ